MDIEVHSMVSCQDIMTKLNDASVPGIEIISVKILPDTAGNAMASVAAAAYTVRFRDGREPATDIAAILPEFLAKERIPVTKKTKKGSRELDLKQGLFQLTCKNGTVSMLVDASSSGNIKPAQVMEALLAENGESLQENALVITREEVYTRTEAGESGKLISLDDVGLSDADVI